MAEPFSAELSQLVQEELATGRYESENDLLLAAVRLLAERDQQRELLRRELEVGRDELDRGDYHEYDEVSLRAYFDELQERGKRRFEASRQTS